MKRIKTLLSLILAVCLLSTAFAGLSVIASAAQKWVTTWATSTVNGSVSVSAISLQDIIPSRSTVRTELTVTLGGTKQRFCFSNQYGSASIRISQASVAKTDGSGSAKITDGTQTAITFNGNTYVDIPAGETVWSDAIAFRTAAFDKISVSLYFENLTYITSAGLCNGRSYLASGSALLGTTSKVNNVSLGSANEMNMSSGSITYHTIPFLCTIDTLPTDSSAFSAVFIGDSTLVNDTYMDYAKKAANAGASNMAVVNEAIIGNKLLSEGTGLIGKLYGDSLLSRFRRDALDLSGVKYCFVKIGLNDILHQYTKSLASTTPKYNAYDIINGYKKLIERAHSKGIKIYFFTKTAWNGYERSFLGQNGDLTWNEDAQKMCDELDEWIKSNDLADGYIDCSPLADPSDKTKLCPTLTTDGAHLTDLGAVALADLIPLEYVGLLAPEAKSAAAIMGVDPYAEKRKIEKDIEDRKNAPPTTSAPENETPGEEPATTPEDTTATVPVTIPVIPPSETIPFVIPTTAAAPEITTPYVPMYEIPTTDVPATDAKPDSHIDYGEKKNVNYVVNDIDVDEIGTEAPVGFILLLFSSIMAAGVVVILTIGKKKEQF